jgi:transcription elongation factor GreB
MGRWRPPQAKSSPYITAPGYQALREELKALWVKRAKVVKALSAAAAEGDRSENAEYIYRKKELGGIDRRIRYIQKRLPDLNVVAATPPADRIFFGAWVKLQPNEGAAVEYRIVGPDETDSAAAYISMDSPLAKALLKKSVDDEIELKLADKKSVFTVLAIRYEPVDD